MKPFRLGMLGMWHTHADGMARQIVTHPAEFEWVGCYDPEPAVCEQRRKAWRDLFPDMREFSTPEELLEQPLDGVVIEGRVTDNLRWARMALESGRPVLLEKPAGCDLQEHRRVAALAQDRGLHLQMTYLFRYMPAIQEILRWSRRGDFGHIYMMRGRMPKELSIYHRWVEELAPYHGGIFFEMAGHLVDLMVTLLGKPQKIHSILAHHHTAPPASFNDNGVAIFGCEGAHAVIEVPALETAPTSRRIEVYGTEGSCIIPHLGSGHLANRKVQVIQTVRAGQADWETLELEDQPLQINDLREFVAVVRGTKPPEWTREHDLDVQETLLTASGMLG